MSSKYVGFGKKLFDLALNKGEKSKVATTIIGVTPKVNKTKLDKAKSKLAKAIQKTKASGAKLDQTRFELKNKMPLTFKTNKQKTKSNTELEKEKKQENKTKVFKAPENFNKGGRVGLKFGSRKSNVQKIQETFGPKKKVPNKFKGFSKLPEKVQQKIDAKLAKKV